MDSEKERHDKKRSLCHYKNIKTFVKTDGKQRECEVGVHQHSVLRPLLIAKNVRERDVKELLYADDFVLLRNGWEEVDKIYMVKKSYDGKRFESKYKNKSFLYW